MKATDGESLCSMSDAMASCFSDMVMSGNTSVVGCLLLESLKVGSPQFGAARFLND